MKKLLCLLLSMILLLSVCGVATVYAAETDDVYFELSAPQDKLMPGQSVTVTLKGGNLYRAEGIQLYIDYDPMLLEITGNLSANSMLPREWDCSFVKSKQSGRLLYMAYSGLDGKSLGNGELRMQTFTVKVKADAPTYATQLSIDVVKVCDRNANDLAVYQTQPLEFRINNAEQTISTDFPMIGDGADVYQAEDADFGGGMLRELNDGSGSVVVTRLGDGEAVTFQVDTQNAGERKLHVFYNTTADRSFDITVNGGEAIKANCPKSGDGVAESVVTVYLNEGSNTLVFDCFGKAAPNLDRIEVERLREMRPTEEFAYLVDQIVELDTAAKMVDIKAAKLAYNRLSDRQKQEVAEKLALLEGVEQAISNRVIVGDVDADGSVNVSDIIKVKNLIMAGVWTDEELAAGDMNNSGKLDVADIIAIKNLIMGA